MAKKITRGITGIKDINKQDFDTNNVNDLLSDGQYNYIHRKKGKSEEYHNLTDNIKTISSDNTDLLTVTNNNKTNNTALLSPKHDAQKEQVLESERATITIQHGTNATPEKTKVDTNPQKVLEHENLISNSQYVTIEHQQESNTSEIKTNNLDSKLSELTSSIPKSVNTTNLIKKTGEAFTMRLGSSNTYTTWDSAKKWTYLDLTQPSSDISQQDEILPGNDEFYNFKPTKGMTYTQTIMIETDATYNPSGQAKISWYTHNVHSKQNAYIEKVGDCTYQLWSTYTWNLEDKKLRAFDLFELNNILNYRTSGTYLAFYKPKLTTGKLPSDWNPSPEDIQEQMTTSLAQKQNTLTSNESIGVSGNGLRQLYALKQTYSHVNGLLKTYVKAVSENTNVYAAQEEFNFILKINQGTKSATFTLNEHEKTKFNNIITTYGAGNGVRINGALFELSNSTLTVTTDGNTGNNYVITFSDII